MSLILHELLDCCRHLENDKATERKVNIQNSTRNTLNKYLQKFIQKETESLQAAKANVSATTQANRQKKLQEISSLVKYFIRCANKRRPRLKCQELLKHVMDIMQSSYSCAAYGTDYSSILLKDVLAVRKYWCEISQQQWEDLLTLYCRLYLKPSRDINRVLLARIIHTLIRGCCFQTDGLISRLLDFFSKAMQTARSEKVSVVLEHILAALNVLLHASASNCRIRVCKLGEEMLPTLLYIWTQNRPQDCLKEEIIEFFRLQLRAHHPKGARTRETGAFASSWAKWQSLLYNLYDAVVNEINQIGSRGKYTSGSRHAAVKESLVAVTADICHQLFTQDASMLEMTQSAFATTQRESGQETPSKRRRTELGWEVIRENLQRTQNDFDIIPWLQITAVLIANYPSSLPSHELAPVLNVLLQLLSQQKRGERTPYALRCLREIAVCQSQKADLTLSQGQELPKLWAKIWAITVSIISSQQTETEGYELLTAVIKGGLFVIDKEFWKLFSQSACKPSWPTVQCLSWALLKLHLPERLEVGMEYNALGEGVAFSSLREAIIKWLLSYQTEEDGEEHAELPPVICRDFPHLVLPQVLVSLTIKDCKAGMDFFQHSLPTESIQCVPDRGDDGFSEVEELYLQTTFDKTPVCVSPPVNGTEKKSAASAIIVNQALKEKLEHHLLAVTEQLLNNYSSESTPAECLIQCTGLLTGVLGCYCYTGVISEEDACNSNLFQKAKSVMQYAGEYVSLLKNKFGEESKLSSLRSLVTRCMSCLNNCTKGGKISSELFLQLLPSRFLNDLADLCKHLLTSSGKSSTSSEMDLMEDDPEESRMEGQGEVAMDLFEDDHDRPSDLGDFSDTGEVGIGAKSSLSEEHLTKQDSLLLDTLRFLCGCVTAGQMCTVSFRPADIRRKLLLLIEENSLDTGKPLHLQLYLTLLKELPTKESVLPADSFFSLLKPLSNMCSLYRRDQEICAAILTNLLPSIMALGQEGSDAEEMRDVRGQILTVVGAFWHISKEGKCTVLVRTALVKSMKALLETDPHSEWSVLTLRDEELSVSNAFPQFLADVHHQVRMLAAMSANRLFQAVESHNSVERPKALPLKMQQKSFESVYMKVQAGMRVQSHVKPEEIPDEESNRKAALLMLISVVLSSSPVCEKQALFAVCQSVRENGLSPQLVKKVLQNVSGSLGYRNLEDFMLSHLDYLVIEWLRIQDYSLPTFPYVLLNYSSLEEFYRSCYNVLIPHLVARSDFEGVKSLAKEVKKDWQQVLTDCFPKIMVNILPYFAYQGRSDQDVAQRRESASKVYDLLKEDSCLGKQQIDNLIHSNLPEIVVELLMTLHESIDQEAREGAELVKYAGEMDPVPNPPHFPSHIIKATLDYISSCHKTKLKSLVAILSKNPDSIQRILLAICKQAAEATNIYEKHRILIIYRFFVNLLLKEIQETLGGAWAFILRDVIYTLIHHVNSRPAHMDEVSSRSFSLCFDLLCFVCHTAVQFCGDALESHLHVIVGTLTPLVSERLEIRQQVLNLLKYLVIDNQNNENLHQAIKLLDPFPDLPAFKDLRAIQQKLKFIGGPFTLLEEINHFLSISYCDSLPLTRLEGLNELKKQLEQHKDQMKELIKECQEKPQKSVLVKFVSSLLQLCKAAVNHPGELEVLEAVGGCLGEMGPIDFSTIALHYNKDMLYSRAVELFEEKAFQWIFVIINLINNALTDQCIEVRAAAVTCLKSILATQPGVEFWDHHKNSGDPVLVYLQLFRTTRKKFLEVPVVERPDPPENLDDGALWIPQDENHDSWLKTLTCALLDSGGVKSEVLHLSRPMCEVKTDFCQTVLPYLIHDILLHDTSGSWRTLLSKHVQGFFSACYRVAPMSSRSTTPANVDSETDSLIHGNIDKTSQSTMLAVVDYLRRQKRPNQGPQLGTAWDDNFWLDLNYLEVAMAAQSCAAHFTAALYAEVYADKINLDNEEYRRGLTEGFYWDFLIEVYRSIGEPDSLYGCGGGKMLQPLARIRTYEHEAMWHKALVTYDLETNLPASARQAGIIQALQNFGLSHILTTYLKGLENENAEWCSDLREIRFQAAWKNMQWDYVPTVRDESTEPGYHESVFCAVHSLRDGEFRVLHEGLKHARVKEIEKLCKGSLESVYSLYPALSRLQALGELDSLGHLYCRSDIEGIMKEVSSKWQRHSQLLKDSDFTFQEPIMSLRTVIQEILLDRASEDSVRDGIRDILTEHLVELSKLARAAGNTQLPERAISQIKQHNPNHYRVSQWQLEETQVFWDRNEKILALGILKKLIDKLDCEVEYDETLIPMYAECLRLCGNWLAETCLESPGIIMQKYLERAVTEVRRHSGEQLQSGKMKAFLSLARFSDAQYQSIVNYMKSSEFEHKQALLKNAKEEVGLMKEHRVQTTRYTVKVQRELELDERALDALKEDRKRFLCKAVENYINCLESGEEHDMWVFRLCSLWLENSTVFEVNKMMKQGTEKIPSYKFLPLMYQLAARMGTKLRERLGFNEVLNNLISRATLDHPHHTLFIILALANANKDDILQKPLGTKRSGLTKSAPKRISELDEERMEVARNIINKIRKHRPEMVKDIEKLCDAYIFLANMDANQWKAQRKGIRIPEDQPITKIKDLHEVVIPTMEVKVDPSGKYENLVTVSSFRAEFRLAGGVNLPKIIDCVGSDGKERRQLVKGRDDLRQDAVMQQVFQMCNTLLQRNAETRKRKLTIRRYKVVPLSQRSGVLEWCTGTVPIGEFLVNPEVGAHKRYRPKDWNSMQCRRNMVDKQKSDFEAKYQIFMKVCQNFPPVFRYFFMEKFFDPAVWFEKRLAYTRSVATSSIVGYIVGLGDRHVQNILIDEESAELVHIDLGVAFEQGKILPTPETVPFRLTRDIVDGMGIAGVEGVFRRCCEKTMEVMRNSQEALLTIVEVLLYDPLFDWTMNPLKALYLQERTEEDADLNATLNSTMGGGGDDQECNRKSSNDAQNINKVAGRVLLRLQEKLKGVEEGTVLNVGGQVNLLIQQAMDPKNLSRLFPGWQPWV
nr:PREDICTED: serine-protein kinase ATM [Latimeria chalumnae]|eukprot:XP_014351298.1 PREDICTED: serine-protein kinase ATM [Latimeria chalumnae]